MLFIHIMNCDTSASLRLFPPRILASSSKYVKVIKLNDSEENIEKCYEEDVAMLLRAHRVSR